MNDNRIKRTELLAPAGSFETLLAVINAGADAVYLSGKKFGARAYASNFDDDELIEAIKVAHLFGKKIYLTVNTLIKENEMRDLESFLSPLCQAGLDGIIMQDVGAVFMVRKLFPKLSVHISTQTSLTLKESAILFKKMGIERIVTARELNLDEIKAVKESGIEVECFIHGAMCYSYSGYCLFSSIVGQRSGNRGRCAQPCRLPYYRKVKGKEIYPLSMKDMCTINILDRLLDAGIDSLKIEGRMKKAEYAAMVTAIYRKYIDQYYENNFVGVLDEDIDILNSLYIRKEISEGYYNRHNGREMITVDSPSYNGADERLLEIIREKYINKAPYLNIDAEVRFMIGAPIQLKLKYMNIFVECEGDIVEQAKNAPIKEERLREQLLKMGNTYFRINSITVITNDDGFLPMKSINEVKRNAVYRLEEEIINA